MSQTTYGPGGINHLGTIISMVDQDGNITSVSFAGDSTVVVNTLRTAPDPVVIYAGTSAGAAGSAVSAQLQNDGTLP